MKRLKILAAALIATFAVAANANPPGPPCAPGTTPGTGDCPAYGAGPGPHHGHRQAMMQERLKAADTNGDGLISREEAQASLPRLAANFDAIDTNKDGFLSSEELQAAHQSFAQTGRGEGWKRWDANGDGKLSREEVANAPRLAQSFDAIDANKDGFLTADELQAARLARASEARGRMFARLDADGDGRLSRAEVANAPRLAQEFDAIDTNKDGYLSPDELQAAHARMAGRGWKRGS